VDGPVHVGGQKLPSQLLPIGFVSAVVFNLNMEIKTTLTAVESLARLVGADEAPVDLTRRTPQVLLAPVLVLAVVAAIVVVALFGGGLFLVFIRLSVFHGRGLLFGGRLFGKFGLAFFLLGRCVFGPLFGFGGFDGRRLLHDGLFVLELGRHLLHLLLHEELLFLLAALLR